MDTVKFGLEFTAEAEVTKAPQVEDSAPVSNFESEIDPPLIDIKE